MVCNAMAINIDSIERLEGGFYTFYAPHPPSLPPTQFFSLKPISILSTFGSRFRFKTRAGLHCMRTIYFNHNRLVSEFKTNAIAS